MRADQIRWMMRSRGAGREERATATWDRVRTRAGRAVRGECEFRVRTRDVRWRTPGWQWRPTGVSAHACVTTAAAPTVDICISSSARAFRGVARECHP